MAAPATAVAPPAPTSPSVPVATPTPAGTSDPAASAAPAEEAEAQPDTQNAPEAPPADIVAEPAPSPVSMLTLPTVAFQIDYEDSTPRHRAEVACSAQTKDDAKAKSDCLQKARDAFLPDVLRFKKGPKDRWQLVVYKRTGSELREVYSTSIDLSDAAVGTVRIKLLGREQGQKPLLIGRSSSLLTLPNEYSFELDDPKLGKLLYSGKSGLVGE
jgi:hypothetical protein